MKFRILVITQTVTLVLLAVVFTKIIAPPPIPHEEAASRPAAPANRDIRPSPYASPVKAPSQQQESVASVIAQAKARNIAFKAKQNPKSSARSLQRSAELTYGRLLEAAELSSEEKKILREFLAEQQAIRAEIASQTMSEGVSSAEMLQLSSEIEKEGLTRLTRKLSAEGSRIAKEIIEAGPYLRRVQDTLSLDLSSVGLPLTPDQELQLARIFASNANGKTQVQLSDERTAIVINTPILSVADTEIIDFAQKSLSAPQLSALKNSLSLTTQDLVAMKSVQNDRP